MKTYLRVWVGGLLGCALVAACTDRPVVATQPRTTNLYVEPISYQVIDKIDLLFMIDNSRSMGDKQELLAHAVPQLVDRLVVPRCVNLAGEVTQRGSLNEQCPAGSAAEFRAVKDIHVAVISSSLGAHGAASPACVDAPPDNDHARLLPTVRGGQPTYANKGFLAWDPEQRLMPPGEGDAQQLGRNFAEMVRSSGEVGCGYEASLEAWYRFLVDPEPPLAVTVGEDERNTTSGIDQEVLAQRAAFLRPDSLVAIVMLTDENDCSIRDDEFGYLLATHHEDFRMPRASSACERDPNDSCCRSCIDSGPTPAGCAPLASDAACQLGSRLSKSSDNENLRCLQNKRRFGYDFLQPTSRYVEALTEPLVVQRSTGEKVVNPLFQAPPGKSPRGKDLIYLAGIVGVPWQDIADEASLHGEGLRYLSAAELSSEGRWDVIVGDPKTNRPPSDPFMHESVAPRSGVNPITGDAVMAETSSNPRASVINGHEQSDQGDDLQYACIFPLLEPELCDDESCDCAEDLLGRNRALCQPPAGGATGTTQYFGKAYPGLRHLEVLSQLGESAIVASICPKVLEMGRPGYGYEPAVDAIVDRLKVVLAGRCPPRPLAVAQDESGRLPCVVVEAQPPGGTCSCAEPGRSVPSPQARSLVRRQMAEGQRCSVGSAPSCDAFCYCEIEQAAGPTLDRCLNDELGTEQPGYCYVDPFGDPPQGNPALVQACGASKRLIRFVGTDTPTPGATAYIACWGATLH